MNNKNILNFFAELGTLKRVIRSGWWMIGIEPKETVAAHSFRCAAIGYILAKMEKVDPYKVLIMTLFNDLHEARINDLHKVAHRYLNVREGEKKAFKEQVAILEKNIREELVAIRKEHDAQKTRVSLIARDADILECLIQAKEYLDAGFKETKRFFKNAPKHLKTKSALKLWKSAKNWDSYGWWDNLEEFER